MNEGQELREYPEQQETMNLSSLESIKSSIESVVESVKDYWNDWFGDSKDEPAQKEITEEDGDFSYSDQAREYGLKDCSDAAKEVFTTDVIRNWGIMDVNSRDEIAQEYAEKIGEGLDINFKGIVWEEFPSFDGTYTYGYNSGDGYLHLNTDFLVDPSMLMSLVDTVAHEARHQFQTEAIANPDKFGIDEATVNEWKTGFQVYTQEGPTAYDPWGYTYNPVEIDARYFGESMVRELTKDIINQA